MDRKNYFLYKNSKSGEITYLEFDKKEYYNITPKTKIEDAIKVDKIVFVNPGMSEKLIKKKIDIKIRYLLKCLSNIEDDGGNDEDGIRNTLMTAEKLKVNILNTYAKYLGNTYQSLSLKKVQVIINQLKMDLYECTEKKKKTIDIENLYYLDEDRYSYSNEEEYRGRSR